VQLQVLGFRSIVTVLGITSKKIKGESVRGISVAATSDDECLRDRFRCGNLRVCRGYSERAARMVDTLISELSSLSSAVSNGIACETSREFQSWDF
jgi:hypothetical protein